jgi:predicted RNase H-like HicB family nuclease
MATTDRFDGFTVNVYQDDEGDYLAHFVELPSVSAFAATPEEALNELAEAWAGVRESYEKRGEAVPVAPARREYSGSLMCGSTSAFIARLPLRPYKPACR